MPEKFKRGIRSVQLVALLDIWVMHFFLQLLILQDYIDGFAT